MANQSNPLLHSEDQLIPSNRVLRLVTNLNRSNRALRWDQWALAVRKTKASNLRRRLVDLAIVLSVDPRNQSSLVPHAVLDHRQILWDRLKVLG